MNRVKVAVLKKIDPEAFERPLLASLLEHQERIANDPKIRAENARIAAEVRRELLPAYVAAAVLTIAMWSALGWFLPGLFNPAFAVSGCAATLAFLYALARY